MKIVIAPNAFKGSLSAYDACCAMAEGIAVVLPEAEILKLPVADGGDGTVDALAAAAGGRRFRARVTGPLGREVEAGYAVLEDGTAVLEMAAASGLALLKEDEKNPVSATTYGTGELIREALDRNCSRIIMGIGGSATNDGGAGMAQALGVRLLDASGRDIGRGGGELSKLHSIDVSRADRRLEHVDITVASDVVNTLCGPGGASYVYGPQKGATPVMAEQLDRNLHHYSEIIKRDTGRDVRDAPGSGAAGGLGAGLIAFAGAKISPGAKVVMDAVGFPDKARGAAFVITGEGRIDEQTAYGKAPGAVASICRDMGIPVIGVCGFLDEGVGPLYEKGFTSFFPVVKKPCTLEYAMENAYGLLRDAGVRLAKIIGAFYGSN